MTARRRANAIVALVLLVLAAFALAACGGGSDSSRSGGGTEATNVAGMTSVDLELDDDYFEPATLSGDPGQRLTVELENEGDAEHNFSLDAQSIDQDVEAGDEASVTVTLPSSGSLTFYCKYHRAQGMTGRLTVGGDESGEMNSGSTTSDSGSVGY